MKKAPLILSALFIALVAAAWKWSHVLEARLQSRLEHGQALQLAIAPGNSGSVRYTPPLTDAFALSISDLDEYKNGYANEKWRVEELEFRLGTKLKWKVLPEHVWRKDWHFFQRRSSDLPRKGERRSIFSILQSAANREFLVGQYQLRACYKCEFHDNRSGIRFLGDGTFEFTFHVNSAPKWKKRVVLDSVRKIG